LSYILYKNIQEETAHIREKLFLEMKNYSLKAQGQRFHKEKTQKTQNQKFYTLYEDSQSLYILTPIPDSTQKEMVMIVGPMGNIVVPYSSKETKVFKIGYPQEAYQQKLKEMKVSLFWQFVLFCMGAMLVSLLAAWYTLYPLRSSLRLLEDFIKDIIHDLNTPLSAIMLNLKMIETRDDEIECIQTAAQTIEMLHHNLDAYLREQKQSSQTFYLDDVIHRYVQFFTPLYDYLYWDVKAEHLELHTDKQAFERIIYNLLSNACKYNTSNGTIKISIEGTTLKIQNSSYGVSHPQRVFERFYKESERGLGIGLHIVDKLCHTLQIEKSFRVEQTEVIVALECKNLLHS